MTEDLTLAAPPPTPIAGERHPLLGKTTRTAFVMLALLAVPYVLPRAWSARLRILGLPGVSGQEAAPAPVVPPAVLTEGETTLGESKNEATVTNALPTEPTGNEPDPSSLKKISGALGG